MAGRPESGIRAGAGVEERGGCAYECSCPGTVEPEVFRKAKVCQRIPAVRTSGGGCVRRVEGDEFPHGFFVAEKRGNVDVMRCDFGMRGEDGFGGVERAVPNRSFHESRDHFLQR